MKHLYLFHSVLIAAACAVSAQLALAQPQPPGGKLTPPSSPSPPPSPPSPPSADSFFSSLKNRAIDGANQVASWRQEVEAAGRKTASDFASCPSPEAQAQYDAVKRRRDQLKATQEAATRAEQDAIAARDQCKRSIGDVGNLCNLAYNELPFTGTKNAAGAAITAANTAMNALKALRCVTCDRKLVVDFPVWRADQNLVGMGTVPVGLGANAPVPVPMAAGMPGAAAIPVAGPAVSVQAKQGAANLPSVDVCTEWDPGSATLAVSAGNGEIDAQARARLPRCRRTVAITPQVCTAWDVAGMRSQLETLIGLPRNINPLNVKIDVPMQNIQVLQGLQPASCTQPVRACTQLRGSVTVNVDTGRDPIEVLRGVPEGNCGQYETMGCAQPPLGVAPRWGRLQVPDLRQGTVTWDLKPVKLDLSPPNLRMHCKQWEPVSVPTWTFQVGVKTQATPICLTPKFIPLVANP